MGTVIPPDRKWVYERIQKYSLENGQNMTNTPVRTQSSTAQGIFGFMIYSEDAWLLITRGIHLSYCGSQNVGRSKKACLSFPCTSG